MQRCAHRVHSSLV